MLIAEVAARGPHVVTILDCCHAGGGTRDPFARPRSWRPLVDAVDVASRDVAVELAAARPATEFLPGTLDQWSAPRAPHVALGACRSDELAKEHSVGDVTRGAFSVALIESLDVLGTRTTYRSLLASVRARVERTAADQRPQLEPLDVGGLGDRLFLDGSVVPVSPTFTVTLGPDGWEVDGGLVHGFRDPVGDEAFELACSDDDGTVAGVVRVRHVEIGRSLVEPVGMGTRGPRLPRRRGRRPAAAGRGPARPADRRRSGARRCRRRAPGGACRGRHRRTRRHAVDRRCASSTRRRRHRARCGSGSPSRSPARRASPGPTAARSSATSPPPTAPAPASSSAASSTSPRGSWCGRWAITRHRSPSLVALDLYAVDGDERRRPDGRRPLPADGSCVLTYRTRPDGTWEAPQVFMELRSSAERDLYVAVLDLTDRFRCEPVLPTVKLGAGRSFALADGDPIPASLPPDEAVVAARRSATGSR